MGKPLASEPAGWLDYFMAAAAEAGYVERGWRARLSRDLEVYDSHVSRWSNGERTPDIDSCKKLAKAFGRPIPEVLIAAGHFTAEELGMPEATGELRAPHPLPPVLERLRRFLDDPDLPEMMRKHIEAQIAATADLVEGATGSAERRIS